MATCMARVAITTERELAQESAGRRRVPVARRPGQYQSSSDTPTPR